MVAPVANFGYGYSTREWVVPLGEKKYVQMATWDGC
jgi:hypothetical protein